MKKDLMKWALILLIIATTVFILSRTAGATGSHRDDGNDQDQTQDQSQEQSQDQDQSQDQLQDQSQSQQADQANSQSLSLENRTPGRSFVGGGDSTSDDQKVFAISGGWLTGSAGIRLDLTDKDARKLRVAAEWRADGRVAAADQLTCSIKDINKAFGGADTCYTLLAESKVIRITNGEAAIQQAELDEMRQQMRELRRMIEQQEEVCDRQFESCVRGK